MTFYTGISLNYRFDIAVQVHAREAADDNGGEEPRPHRKKKEPTENPAPSDRRPPRPNPSTDVCLANPTFPYTFPRAN